MPKFTPGPWIVFKSKIEGTWIDPIGLRVDDCGLPKTREANARLIAAAPEMYQLILDLLDELNFQEANSKPSKNYSAHKKRAALILKKIEGSDA